MKKLMLIAILISLFLVNNVFAMSYNSSCLDSNTVLEVTEINHYVDGVFQETEMWNQTITCVHGCYNGQCNENTLNYGIEMVLGLVGIAGVLGYFSFSMKKENWFLQIVLFITAYGMLLLAIFMIYRISEARNTILEDTTFIGYRSLLLIFLVVMGYLVISFIINVMKFWRDLGEGKKELSPL